MNVVTVTINGMEYNLKGTESEEYLRKVAKYVDKRLNSTLESNSKLSIASAAVLTAINAVDDMFKCSEAYEEMEGKIKEALKAEANSKAELEALKDQLKNLEACNAELENKIKLMSQGNYAEDLQTAQENAQKYKEENLKLKNHNKELRFQLQSYKYKTMDLQSKVIENGIQITKLKKDNNPLLASEL
jgi:cell division protein ZapA